MTNITLMNEGKRGKICGYRVEGHAGYAPNGEDIVCAAISILATTCANSLTLVAGMKPEIIQKDALLEVKLRRPNRKARVVFDVFVTGVNSLGKEYPHHLEIHTR